MSLYANDGSYNVSIVDGSTHTGLYANDGSWNVVSRDGSTLTGLYHPCGGYNVVANSGLPGVYHPCGALNVTTSPYTPTGTVKVTPVSGSFNPGAGFLPWGLVGLYLG